jgi:hypothetical protein
VNVAYGIERLVGFELVDVTHISANVPDTLSVGNVINLDSQEQCYGRAYTQLCPSTDGSKTNTAANPLCRKKIMAKRKGLTDSRSLCELS